MRFEGWICKNCRLYNDILTDYCISCNGYKPEHITSTVQAVIEIRRDIFDKRGVLGVSNMNEAEELFSKFYNHEKILVKDMDSVQLREHRDELSKIAFEAKARLVALDDEGRERNAKNGKKDWSLSPTGLGATNQNESDAINAPKLRKARMSALDKQRAALVNLGMDESIINEMMSKLEKNATDKNLKAITFTKAGEEDKVVIVETKKPDENVTPFNPSGIKFN